MNMLFEVSARYYYNSCNGYVLGNLPKTFLVMASNADEAKAFVCNKFSKIDDERLDEATLTVTEKHFYVA